VFRKIDVREHGSGNPGATNAVRVLGWPLGLTALALDMAKGAAPPLILGEYGLALTPEIAVLGALAAILGHVFPITLRFRGGKGVATAAGAFLVLDPAATLVAFGVFALVALISRIVSIASLLATLSLCLASFAIHGSAAWNTYTMRSALFILTAGIVFLRHHSNIKRLFQGVELPVVPAHTEITTTNSKQNENSGV